jgi:hypothetical protein
MYNHGYAVATKNDDQGKDIMRDKTCNKIKEDKRKRDTMEVRNEKNVGNRDRKRIKNRMRI